MAHRMKRLMTTSLTKTQVYELIRILNMMEFLLKTNHNLTERQQAEITTILKMSATQSMNIVDEKLIEYRR